MKTRSTQFYDFAGWFRWFYSFIWQF